MKHLTLFFVFFVVSVTEGQEEPTCNTRSAPKNGALACFKGLATYCNPFCQDGYEFSYKPEGTYFCYGGLWQYWTRGVQVLISERQEWPDCVARQDPSSGNLKMSQSFYYQGDCLDKDVQDKLKSKFHNYLVTMSPALSCLITGAKCSPASVTIRCGAKVAC